ncbi:unnamed protein product [Rangifer tarandus platyrhynchus]|uniref:Uncharacterized protein n=1 Tax=Rangifer tarandus platyrhynchus TaxID=3082113 RepID=A0AC59YWH2_RANTA
MELNKCPSSLSSVLCPGSPTQGQDKEPCALATCAFSGRSALSKSSWTRDHLAASGSPRLNTTGDRHRLAVTLSSLAGGQDQDMGEMSCKRSVVLELDLREPESQRCPHRL